MSLACSSSGSAVRTSKRELEARTWENVLVRIVGRHALQRVRVLSRDRAPANQTSALVENHGLFETTARLHTRWLSDCGGRMIGYITFEEAPQQEVKALRSGQAPRRRNRT